jgi:putative transposase
MRYPKTNRHRRSCNEPGHAHELTFTCYRRFRFLSAERPCQWLCDAINEARTTLEFELWAFVFMPEHVHLILWPRQPKYEMASILKAIKEPVGRKALLYLAEHAPQWLPRITRKRGNRTERLFWQSGGGFDRNIDEPSVLMSMLDYVHQNPVRRGLVARPVDWRWSSAGWFDGMATCDLIPDPIPADWVPQG